MEFDENGNLIQSRQSTTSGFFTNPWGPSAPAVGSGIFGGATSNLAAPVGTPNQSGLFSSFLQGKNQDGSSYGGYGQAGLGLLQGVGSMYMGLRQYGLAKDQLAFGKEQFNKNYAAQRTTTNTALEDRQAARVAANPGAYQSVSDYMNKNRIN